MSWGIKFRNGKLGDEAFRTRQQAMDWAGQRFTGVDDYRNNPLSEVWRGIKRRHGMSVVRVTVSEDAS